MDGRVCCWQEEGKGWLGRGGECRGNAISAKDRLPTLWNREKSLGRFLDWRFDLLSEKLALELHYTPPVASEESNDVNSDVDDSVLGLVLWVAKGQEVGKTPVANCVSV